MDYHGWWDSVYEDFKQRMSENFVSIDKMFFSGFGSQGDGACFEGCIECSKTLAYLDKHHPNEYPMIRKLLSHDGDVIVSVKHSGSYYHAYSTEMCVESDRFCNLLDAPSELQEQVLEVWGAQLNDEITDFELVTQDKWRGYMNELYKELSDEYYALTEDDAVWDSIEANNLMEDEEEDDAEEDGVCGRAGTGKVDQDQSQRETGAASMGCY